LVLSIELTWYFRRPGILVTSEEAKKLSEQFWKETMDVLRKQNPDVDTLLGKKTLG
jgi:hypothetical protein